MRGYDYILEVLRILKKRLTVKNKERYFKKQEIYYLIDLENRELPQNNSPTSASFGIFNWWWGEDADNEQPPNFLQRFLDLHELSKVELRMKITPKTTFQGNKSVLAAMVLNEELT